MAAPERNQQQLEPEITQQQAEEKINADKNNIDEMLNDKGFTEFLGNYKDRIDLSNENADQIQERYQRFKQVGSTIKEVQNILAQELSNETGVKISGSEIIDARKYLEDMAVNNEGEFERTLETIKDYHRISEQTDQLIEEVSQRFKDLEQKQGTIDEVKQISGFKRWVRLGLNERQGQAIANAKALKLDVHHPEKSDLALEREGASATRQVEGMLTQQLNKFDEVRMELMTSLGENTGARKLANDKIAQKLTESIGTSLSDVDRASSMYSEYSANEDEGELTFKYLEGTEGFDRKEYEKQLNEESESRVTKEIKTAVEQSPLTQGKQFSQLESALDKYTKRETLGTKNQEQTKQFVLGVVHEMYSRYAIDPKRFQNKDTMSKSFLLQRILIKFGVSPKEDYAKATIEAEERKRQEDEAAAKAEEEKQRQEEEAAAKAAQNETESSDDANSQASTEPASSTANQSSQQPEPTPMKDEINPDDNQII